MASTDPSCVPALADALNEMLSAVNRLELAQQGYERVDDELSITGWRTKADADTRREYDTLVRLIEQARETVRGVDVFVRPALGTKPGAWTTALRSDLAGVKTCIDLAGYRVPTRGPDASGFPPSVRQFDELIDSIRERMLFLHDLDTPSVGANGEEDKVPEDLISQEEAADMVQCSARTIRRRISDGLLRSYEPTGKVSEREVQDKLHQVVKRRSRPKKKRKTQ